MQSFIGKALAAVFVVGLMMATAVEAAEPLRIGAMTFNIRQNTARDGENQWPKRIDLVVGVIERGASDFIGMQEALPGQLKDLTQRLPGYAYVGRGRAKEPDRDEASPIFYRKDRWRALSEATFWLSDTPREPGSASWGNRVPRIATMATFEHTPTKRRVTVLNTHFDHRSQSSREKSAALVIERLRAVEGPVVVTGDFNAGEDNAAIRAFIEAGYVDTYRAAHPDAKTVGTFNGFAGRRDGAKIDYVFVRRGVKTLDADIVRDHEDGRYPSDHFPVWAIVEFAGEGD